MSKSLDNADRILKLVLAFSTVCTYVLRVITGPLATVLFLLSLTVIIIFVAQVAITLVTRD